MPANPAELNFPPDFIAKFQRCEPFTMVDPVRMYALYLATLHVTKSNVPGDLVECGVWRGGCCMLMAMTLLAVEPAGRRLWLYDTFAGMTEPGEHDVRTTGENAHSEWQRQQAADHNAWCYAGLEEVKANMASTGYDPSLMRYVVGQVEDTLPAQRPDRIAVLRLDTDWYGSTYHELTHLYPRLSLNGVIIFDDYLFWKGQAKAAQRYFAEQHVQIQLRHTSTGVMGIKTASAMTDVERRAQAVGV